MRITVEGNVILYVTRNERKNRETQQQQKKKQRADERRKEELHRVVGVVVVIVIVDDFDFLEINENHQRFVRQCFSLLAKMSADSQLTADFSKLNFALEQQNKSEANNKKKKK